MDSISKGFSLLVIVVLAVSSLIAVKPASAQVGVTTPSMPEFGVGYETFTTYVPPVYGVDPSTGKAVITQEGYNKVDRWVKVSISNQPFTRYKDSNGETIQLFYDVRWKEHQDSSWETLPDDMHFTQNPDFYLTGIFIGFKGYHTDFRELIEYTPGSQIDFQVEASIGYYTANNVFIGKTSGWTNTHTLTLPATIPEFPSW